MSRVLSGALVAFCALLPTSATPSTELRSAFSGRYVYSQGPAGYQHIEHQIQDLARKLNPFIRSIAVHRLRDACRPKVSFRFSWTRELLQLETPEQKLRSQVPVRGLKLRGKRGKKLSLSRFWQGRQLVQVSKNSQGEEETRFILAKDGLSLTVQIEIRSSHFPHPLRYKLEYQKVP